MHRVSARRMYAPGQTRSNHRAHRHPHRRNRPDAPMPSKPQGRLRQHHLRHWKKIHHVSARTIYAPGQKQSTRRAYQRQRRRSQSRRARVKRTKKSRAEKPSARDNLYTEQPEIRPADSVPQEGTPSIREKPKAPEIRGQVQSETVPAKTSAIRHAKQPDTWTPRSAAAPAMRGKEQSVRERSAVTPAHDLPPIPQEQAQQVFVEKQTQLSQNPSIESIYPSEPAAPILPQPPVSEAPAITLERQPVTAGSGKPAPLVQPPKPAQTPPAEQLPAIREKPKPNAAPRERPPRGVNIRTRDTEQISAPKAQSKTSASKTATKRARKAATQDAQRKMLKKSNNCAARAAAAAAKKLAEAAAKAGQGADKRPRQSGWRHGAFCRVFHRHCCGGVFGFSVGDSLC